jgi:hypothetical protein
MPCRGVFECPLTPRRPRRLPRVVPTVQPAGDLRLEMERYQVGLAIQAPSGSISQPPIGARAVQPGVEADRGRLGGAAVYLTRGRLTLIRSALSITHLGTFREGTLDHG